MAPSKKKARRKRHEQASGLQNQNSRNDGGQFVNSHIEELHFNNRRSPSPDPAEDHKKNLIRALKFDGMEDRRENIEMELSETCQWLHEVPEWKQWQQSLDQDENHHPRFLWIKGKPGAGKSTLMNFALSYQERHTPEDIILSHFFDARGSQIQQSTEGLYRHLLVQLLKYMPPGTVTKVAPDEISTRHKDWKLPSLEKTLKTAMQAMPQVSITIFIDALDECDISQARKMVFLFRTLCNDSSTQGQRLRLCLASRHYPSISIPATQSLQFAVEDCSGHEEDIRRYINERLRIPFGQMSCSICDELNDKARGVFIYVRLVLDVLEPEIEKGNLFRIQEKLRDIPDDLSDLYVRILTKESEDPRTTMHCLQWVMFCMGPLCASELWWAIHLSLLNDYELQDLIDLDNTIHNCGPDTIKRFVFSASRGLIEETSETSKNESHSVEMPVRSLYPNHIRFIHQTVPDFLLKRNKDGNNGFEILNGGALERDFRAQSHQQLSKICGFSIWATANLAGEDEVITGPLEDSLFRYDPLIPVYADEWETFLVYALSGIFEHAEQAQNLGISQFDFLRNFNINEWNRAYNTLVIRFRRGIRRMNILFTLWAFRKVSHPISLEDMLNVFRTPNLRRMLEENRDLISIRR